MWTEKSQTQGKPVTQPKQDTPDTTVRLPRLAGTLIIELIFSRRANGGCVSVYWWPNPPAGECIASTYAFEVSVYKASANSDPLCLYIGPELYIPITAAELARVRAAIIASGISHSEHIG